jgi:HSP20 family protein
MKLTTQTENKPAAEQRPAQEAFTAPLVNIFENNEGYVLEAEMPGVTKEGLDLTLDDNELTLTGQRQADTAPGRPLFRESREVHFRRTFQLDPAIDTARIAARIDQGVLRLTLPKSEKVKARKISVE